MTTVPAQHAAAAAEGAASPAQLAASPDNPLLWTALGLAALVVVGVAGALYVGGLKPALSGQETELTAEEFDITTK